MIFFVSWILSGPFHTQYYESLSSRNDDLCLTSGGEGSAHPPRRRGSRRPRTPPPGRCCAAPPAAAARRPRRCRRKAGGGRGGAAAAGRKRSLTPAGPPPCLARTRSLGVGRGGCNKRAFPFFVYCYFFVNVCIFQILCHRLHGSRRNLRALRK